MVHLTGCDPSLALQEAQIYADNGFSGVIVENYHCKRIHIFEQALEKIVARNLGLAIGVNVLSNEFREAYRLTREFGASFIQLDYISGFYEQHSGWHNDEEISLNYEAYKSFREDMQDIVVLGGVWPKGYRPCRGARLRQDIYKAMNRCDAIVVTGEGTSIETPMDKVLAFREIIDEKDSLFPLLVGSGLNEQNYREQLGVSDGAIVGSSIKYKGRTENEVDAKRVFRLKNLVDTLQFTSH